MTDPELKGCAQQANEKCSVSANLVKDICHIDSILVNINLLEGYQYILEVATDFAAEQTLGTDEISDRTLTDGPSASSTPQYTNSKTKTFESSNDMAAKLASDPQPSMSLDPPPCRRRADPDKFSNFRMLTECSLLKTFCWLCSSGINSCEGT